MDREKYLENVKSEVRKERSERVSKVELRVVELVEELMSKNEVTTIKTIVNLLNKTKNYSSYIRVLVNKSDKLEFVKVNGICLIVTK